MPNKKSQQVVAGCVERNLEKIYSAFRNDPLVTLPDCDARKLFDEMVENTKEYLTEYLT